jgi:hypothetical protein
VTSIGVQPEDVIAVAATIPAFDYGARDSECATTPSEQLVALWWKCELRIEMPQPTFADLGVVIENTSALDLPYRFRPVLPGGEDISTEVITSRVDEPYWPNLERWEDSVVEMAEDLGIDTSPIDDGTYLIEDVTLLTSPRTDEQQAQASVQRLNDLGFETTLRARLWNRN